MSFFEQLLSTTREDRAQLLDAPFIAAATSGPVNRHQYLCFLERTFHHVKHTVPLLMACGARLPDRQEWLRTAAMQHLRMKIDHRQWILFNVAAAGGDAAAVRRSVPDPDSEILAAYAFDTVMRKEPVGFFGILYVLDEVRVTLAAAAAKTLPSALDLPASAFTYLSRRGSLDTERIGEFETLVNRLERSADRQAVERCVQVTYRLYGNVLRGIDQAIASCASLASSPHSF